MTFTETGNFTITAKVVPENFTVNDVDYTFDRVIVGTVNVKDADYNIDLVVTPSRVGEDTVVNVTVPSDVTGNVTVTVNGTDYPVDIDENGTGSVVIPDLSYGDYNATVTVSDDPKYENKTSDEEPFEVLKVEDYPVDIKVIPGISTENTNVIVSVPEDVTGDVTVTINGTTYKANKVENGTYEVNVKLLSGNYTAFANVTNDPKYSNKKSNESDFEVVKLADYSINPAIVPGNPGESTYIMVIVLTDVTGNVTVDINGTQYNTTKLMPGYYMADVILPEGNYTLVANVANDVKYADGESNKTDFEIKKVASYPIDVNVTPGKVGENTTVTVTVPEDVTGDVTVTINGTEYNATEVAPGVYQTNVTLPFGNYTAYANVSDDPKYVDEKSDDEEFEVKKVSDYPINVIINPNNPGETPTIIVKVPTDVTGDVTVTINGTVYNATKIAPGYYSPDVQLPAGEYIAYANVSNDSKYVDKQSNETEFEVEMVSDYPITVDVVPGVPTESTHITVTVPSDVTGDVTVTINGTVYNTTKVAPGVYMPDVKLPAGNYTAVANVDNDSKYVNKVSNETDFEVIKVTDYPIDVEVEPGVPGEPTNITITVPKDLDGNVTVIIDDVPYNTTKVGPGEYQANVTLPAGNHTIIANITNDTKYADKQSNETEFEISKVDDYSVDLIITPKESGETPYIVVSTPEDVTGNVTVTINGTTYKTNKIMPGHYMVNVELPAGNYTAVANVADDYKYADKQSEEKEFEVEKIADYPISVDVVPGVSGENTTVTVHVPSDVTGNVTVVVDGKEYPVTPVNGTAVVDIPLDSGNHTVTAKVTNDTKYSDKESNVTEFNVAKCCDLEIIITVNLDNVSYGDVVEYIITVINHGPDNATGVIANITISKDFGYVSNNLSTDYYDLKDLLMTYPEMQSFDESTGLWYIGDLAKCETTKLAILLHANYIGIRDVNGTVKGDDIELNYVNNNGSAPVTVTEVSDYPIDVDVVPGEPGENTTVTVHVPEDVTGNVTVVVDGKEYPVTPVNGTAIVEVPLDAGNHTVFVNVTDDPKYADKKSNETDFDVSKISDYPIDVDVVPGNPGDNTIVTVHVPEDVTGDVIVEINGKEYPVTPVNGTAILEIPLNAGEYTASARVVNDPKYADSESDDNDFEISKIEDYDIKIDVIPGKDGEKTVISIKVPKDATGTVVVTVDGKQYKVTPNDGLAILELDLGPGQHTISAKLINDPKYADKESDEITITIPKDSVNNQSEQFEQSHKTGTLSDYPTGNPILVLLLVLVSMIVIPFRRKKE